MKNRHLIPCIALASLLVILAGCGKSEQAAPPASKETKTEKSEPAKAMENVAQQAANTVTAATSTASAAMEGGVKTAQNTANQALSTVTAATNNARSAMDSAFKAVENAVPQTKAPVPQGAAPATTADNKAPATAAPAGGLAALSQDQMVQGLQDALGKGLQQAIASLGHDGGFLTNLNVKIPMPDKLQKVEAALRAMKEDKLADDFVQTMNHAAEQAVPEAGAVFADALKKMSIADAKSILTGSDDAATQYFRTATSTNLYAKFYPIVQQATAKTGVTAAYKKVIEKANVTSSLGGLGSALSSSLLDKDSLDVDAYVTNKAMDGLFKMVADEEKRIRQSPMARTTDILQTVFGALKK
jgi:hypothetical protein